MIATKERRAIILQLVTQKNNVTVNELSKRFGVSEVSIRKDLNEMHRTRLLIRTRGGAMRIPATDSAFDQPIDTKEFENAREKAGIGKLAASLIEDGDTILIDSGTTTLEIVKNLHRFKHLTIVTNAINIAIEALKYERFPVILLGGHLRLSSQSVVGPIAESNIKSFYCDKLFLGVDSFNITAGISTPNLEEANLNQTMISMAKETIAVFDYTKCYKRSFAHICAVRELTAIVSDRNFPSKLRSEIKSLGVALHIANLES